MINFLKEGGIHDFQNPIGCGPRWFGWIRFELSYSVYGKLLSSHL